MVRAYYRRELPITGVLAVRALVEHVTLEGGLDVPRGGVVVLPPLPRPVARVEVNGRRSHEFTPAGFTVMLIFRPVCRPTLEQLT